MTVPEEDAERLPILGGKRRSIITAETEVYSRRWYIMFVFCLVCFDQALIWNTWGPITESSQAVFGWSNGDIGMLANYGNITFIITVMPICWFMDVKGMRPAMLLAVFLIVVGSGIRLISMEPTLATWMANIGAGLVGVGGAVPFAGPALLSSLWFPPDQRTTATATLSFANYLGVASGFIIGPQMVRSPKYSNMTATNGSDSQQMLVFIHELDRHEYKNVTNLSELKTDIRYLLYLHGGLSLFIFLLTIIYFPSRPPKPPSKSASIERTDYVKGLGQLLGSSAVWLTVLAYAIPTGVLGVWSSVLDVNLKPLGISQKTAGYLGFWQTLAGSAAGLVISRFSDIFMRRMKIFLVVLFIGAVATSAWFTVLCEKYIPFNIPSLYTSCILLGVFVNGAIPLFYEITCEASYPVAEGVTGGFLTLVNNFVGICFLLILLVKSIGTSWMNWVLFGSTVLALPLLLMFPERYRRTDLDITITVNDDDSDENDSDMTSKVLAVNSNIVDT